MKWKFEALFKTYAVLLLGLLVWTLWASAQPTNAIPPAATDAAAEERAYLTFGLDRLPPLQRALFGFPLWQYLASGLYVVLAFLVAGLTDWIARNKLRKWAERTKTKLDDLLLALVGGPIKLIALVILLHIGLRVFPWPQAFNHYVSKGLKVMVAFSLTIVALKIVNVLLDFWRQRAVAAEDRALSEQIVPFVRNTAKVFIVIIAALLTCEALGIKITGVLAGLSVGGLALGLAAQDTLANLFAAVAVFIDKPFHVGERIRIDAIEGTVESIGMRSTRVRTPDGHLVTVPNKTVGNATITNITRRPSIRTVMNISVTYDTPVQKLQRALKVLDEIYKTHPMTKDAWITFNRFADSSLNIEVVHFWNATDYREYLRGLEQLNLQVKQRFDAEGIEFAFPTHTVYMKEAGAAAVRS